MSMWIVCSIRPGGLLSVNAVNNVATSLARWRRNDAVFLPVAAFRPFGYAMFDAALVDKFAGLAGLLKIPSQVPLSPHAAWVRRAPVERQVLPAVLRHVKTLDPEIAAGLLRGLAPTG